MEASSSDMPPDRNMMPGTAEGTWRSRVRTVYSAIFSAVTVSPQSAPGRVMEGFSREPSR
jgi:hypothetical protein